MSYLSEQRRTLSFRRLPFAAKRRRARPLVASLLRFGKALLVLLPLALCVAWLLGSTQFAVTEIDIRGVQRVEPSWIDEELREVADSSLLLLDLEALRGRLAEHPWISSLRLTKELPGRLQVSVVEHSPAAVLFSDDGPFLLTREGQKIVPVPEDAEVEGFLIDGRGQESTAEQLARILATVAALQDSATRWARRPTGVRILSPEDLEFSFRGTDFLVRVRSSETDQSLEERISVLHGLLPQLRDRLGAIDTIDLRFQKRIVLAPAAREAEHRAHRLKRRGFLQQQVPKPTLLTSSPTMAQRG